MRKLLSIVGMALAIGVLAPASAPAATGGSSLPFKGSEAGTTTFDLQTAQLHVVGAGQISHMGVTTVEQDAQLVPTSPTTFNWFGTWTATAANGDELSGTSVGSVMFTDAVHSIALVNYTSTAGTGRFVDAVATFDGTAYGTRVAVVGNTSTGMFDATIAGELSY
jgi:hypothetical protein